MTDELNPAKRLHAAANVIRERANAAYPGPWISDDDTETWRLHSAPDPYFPTMQILKAPKHGTPYAEYWPDAANADHIVRWHPGVAHAVANLLTVISGTDPKEGGNGSVWVVARQLVEALGADAAGPETSRP